MGKETLRRVMATLAVIAVLCLGVFGISRVLGGPSDQDLGEGFTFKEVPPSPTSGIPNGPTQSPSTSASKTAEPTASPSPAEETSTPPKTATPTPSRTVPPKKTVTPLPPSGTHTYDDDDDDDELDDDDEADELDDDD